MNTFCSVFLLHRTVRFLLFSYSMCFVNIHFTQKQKKNIQFVSYSRRRRGEVETSLVVLSSLDIAGR